MLTEAQKVFRQATSEPVTAMVFHPTDPVADNAEVKLAISDLTFDSGPGDTPPGISFSSVIAKRSGLKITESLTSPGKTTGESKFALGSVIVDADKQMAQVWQYLDWNSTAVEIYLGATTKEDGSPMLLSEFDKLAGVVDELRAIGDGQFEISFADSRLDFEKEFSASVYKGLGGAFAIRTDVPEVFFPVGTYLRKDHDPAMDVTGSLTIEWLGHVEKLNTVTHGALDVQTPILMNGNNGQPLFLPEVVSVNYGVMINPTLGTFAFAGGLDGGNESTIVESGRSIVIDEPTYFAVTVEADGVSCKFYACRLEDESPVLVGTATLPDALQTGPTDGLQMGMVEGSHFVTYELRTWKETRTLAQLQEFSDGTISNATDFPTMLEMWRFSEGTELGPGPDRVFGEKGVINMEPEGSPANPVWESSYTGDNPDLFPGSVAGKSRAVTYGRVNNLQLARIDTQHHVFGWDSTATTDVVQLRMAGVPMVPEHELLSVALGDFIFAATGNTITLTDPGIGSFAKYIPGQAAPSRLGQRIKIFDATNAANRGIFRVAIDGVSPDGLVLTVADRLVVNETAPAGTRIESYDPDVHYAIDLVRSVVVLKSDPIGDVTGDIVGRMPGSGFAYWTDLFELMVGVTPDTADVAFDPELGIHLTPGSGRSKNQVLDELAKSAYGWWISAGLGVPGGSGYRLGTFSPPGGTITQIMDGPEIMDVDPLPNSPKPFSRFSVGYSRTWHTQSGDGLATSVSAADAQRYGQAYTFEFSTDPAVLLAYPTAVQHSDFKTLISSKPDAVLFKGFAKAMIGTKRHWFKFQFGSFWPFHILLNKVIRVTWDDLTLGLITTECRVTGRGLNTGDYSMTLEAHT